MKKLKAWLEPRYTKIAIYAIVSAIIVFSCCLLIFNSNAALVHTWKLVTAIMSPLVLGMVIAYLLLPVVKILEKKVFGGVKSKKARRNLSVLLIFAIVVAVLVVAIVAVIVAVTKSISAIDLSMASITQFLDSLQEDFADFWKIIEQKLADYDVNLGSIGKTAAGFFVDLKSAASTLLFAVIFSIYFLLDSGIKKYWKKAAHTLMSEKNIDRCSEFLQDADRVFSGYIRGQTLDALIMGSMVTLAFLIADVPYAAVIGILTGLGNLIPFVGPIVGFASLFIVCLTQMAFGKLIIGAIILIIILAIDGNLINPKLLSTNVEVHPILVFLALIAGGEVGGIVGMLVAVPCAALVKDQFEKYVDFKRAEKEKEELERKELENAGSGDIRSESAEPENIQSEDTEPKNEEPTNDKEETP